MATELGISSSTTTGKPLFPSNPSQQKQRRAIDVDDCHESITISFWQPQ